MMQKPTAGAQMAHKAAGTVNTVDAKTGIVTLAHGPVKSLNWPAMTMGFKVKDRLLLDKLGDGKKFEVEFVQEDKDYVITAVK
ncbi:MAG: copper-binding protein [Lautropia sp.]|nr:copper-binding protein [Lautropia sp.]